MVLLQENWSFICNLFNIKRQHFLYEEGCSLVCSDNFPQIFRFNRLENTFIFSYHGNNVCCLLFLNYKLFCEALFIIRSILLVNTSIRLLTEEELMYYTNCIYVQFSFTNLAGNAYLKPSKASISIFLPF